MVAHPSFLIELDYVESIFDPCMCFLQFTRRRTSPGPTEAVLVSLPGGNSRHQCLMETLRNRFRIGKWRVVCDGYVLRPYHPSDGRL